MKKMIFVVGSPVEGQEMWSKIEKEKAAGGYPWTHLNHNEQEEVWINPLKLPEDITRCKYSFVEIVNQTVIYF